MLDASNRDTEFAFRELFDLARGRFKPFVFWVGAGASSWCGYPRWPDLAEMFHARYARLERGYDAETVAELISAGKFPEFFQACKTANAQRFNSLLAEAFTTRPPTPVYQRFTAALRGLPQQFILTTNIDELLEKELPTAATVSRFDLQRALELQSAGKSAVCKLHGSISDLGSTVFTSEDYLGLVGTDSFVKLIECILGTSTVVFIGYSLQDEYVLSMLARNANINSLFGDGPHFVILAKDHPSLPSTVRVIRYLPEPHKDHRSSILVIEELRTLAGISSVAEEEQTRGVPPRDLRSAHLLFDMFPPGTWSTSQTLGISDPSGIQKQVIVGTGFSNDELPGNRSTAMHDLIVGLLCFEHLYAPFDGIGRVHTLIGSSMFWELVESDVLSFVRWQNTEGVIFPNADSVSGGDLGSLFARNPDKTERTVDQLLRKQLMPVSGLEAKAERQFAKLLETTIELTGAQEGGITHVVRGLLLRPSIRHLLGISGGTPVNSIPRWAVYPILRLAYVTKIGAACRVIRISSAKLDFGTAELAGPAFAEEMGSEYTDAAAGYVLAGRFAADLGIAAMADPSLLTKILAFRNSLHGEELRHEVLALLQATDGAEVSVAINGGLRRAVPPAVLEKARDQFVKLYTPRSIQGPVPPAIWNDHRYSEEALIRWRRRSKATLDEYCKKLGLGPYSPCPCGSGEHLKFCCREALDKG